MEAGEPARHAPHQGLHLFEFTQVAERGRAHGVFAQGASMGAAVQIELPPHMAHRQLAHLLAPLTQFPGTALIGTAR